MSVNHQRPFACLPRSSHCFDFVCLSSHPFLPRSIKKVITYRNMRKETPSGKKDRKKSKHFSQHNNSNFSLICKKHLFICLVLDPSSFFLPPCQLPHAAVLVTANSTEDTWYVGMYFRLQQVDFFKWSILSSVTLLRHNQEDEILRFFHHNTVLQRDLTQ